MQPSKILLMGSISCALSGALSLPFGVDPVPYIVGFQVLFFTGMAKYLEEVRAVVTQKEAKVAEAKKEAKKEG